MCNCVHLCGGMLAAKTFDQVLLTLIKSVLVFDILYSGYLEELGGRKVKTNRKELQLNEVMVLFKSKEESSH